MERTTRETLLRIYEETDTIAVVGASTTDGKPGHDIPRHLQAQGAGSSR
jgi:predicted CoA-binding protein